MKQPTSSDLFQVLDDTWPAASKLPRGPWCLREGLGGGQRVSAATAVSDVVEPDIETAEKGMRLLGQHPLFMLRGDEGHLDGWLETRGYDKVDPVTMYLAKTDALVASLALTAAIPSWPPLAIQAELWADGGIDPARLAIMERCDRRKTSILGRHSDTPGGTAFVAASGDIAMLHALEVSPGERRKGVGKILVTAAANWAKANDASWLALAVTTANKAANALYLGLGMKAATHYHYRRAPEAGA